MKKNITEHEINHFLSNVQNSFPNFVAGIICDNDGFMIGTRIPKNFHIHENEMALTAIANRRNFIRDPSLLKVRREIGQNVNLFLLLEKSNHYISRFKSLNGLLESQDLF